LGMGSFIAYVALRADGSADYAVPLAGYALPIMAFGVLAVRSVVHLARRASVGARRILIVGTGEEAQGVANDLGAAGSARRTIVGFYPTSADTTPAGSQALAAPVFPKGLSIDEVVQKYRVDEVIVAVREQRGGGVPMDQLLACRIRGIPVLDLAGFFERAKGEVPTDSLKASWLVYGHGFVQGGLRTLMKRVFDLISSSLLLVIASPVIVLTAMAIKLESSGPIIYRQERVGLGGRLFMCLKFRSMRTDAEQDGVARWATKNDSRVTRVGAFIRKMRIDELPQLISVLKGEMSLVGPRPERPSFVAQLQQQIPFYDIRHSVKPGVTGWAQVRYSYGASVEDARRKHQFDLYYVKNNSLFLDLLVLVETVSVVLFREGAH
jgi:sugar transferase (PEP-CTERM system associated)